MRGRWHDVLRVGAAACGVAVAGSAWLSGQIPRTDTNRVAALSQTLAEHRRSFRREPQTGYLRSALDALNLPVDSQLLVFSRTGAQRAYTDPLHPRALYFDDSVAIGYVPGAPVIEVAAHDSQEGMVFYSLDQTSATPTFVRQTTCLTCHVSASTLGVPGLIARSHHVAEDGSVLPAVAGAHAIPQTPPSPRRGGRFGTAFPRTARR